MPPTYFFRNQDNSALHDDCLSEHICICYNPGVIPAVRCPHNNAPVGMYNCEHEDFCDGMGNNCQGCVNNSAPEETPPAPPPEEAPPAPPPEEVPAVPGNGQPTIISGLYFFHTMLDTCRLTRHCLKDHGRGCSVVASPPAPPVLCPHSLNMDVEGEGVYRCAFNRLCEYNGGNCEECEYNCAGEEAPADEVPTVPVPESGQPVTLSGPHYFQEIDSCRLNRDCKVRLRICYQAGEPPSVCKHNTGLFGGFVAVCECDEPLCNWICSKCKYSSAAE